MCNTKNNNVEQLDICPECESKTIIENDWGEEYCSKCGLVVRTSFDYVGGLKINLPYGKKI